MWGAVEKSTRFSINRFFVRRLVRDLTIHVITKRTKKASKLSAKGVHRKTNNLSLVIPRCVPTLHGIKYGISKLVNAKFYSRVEDALLI